MTEILKPTTGARWMLGVLTLFSIMPTSINAETKIGMEPPAQVVRTASVGSPIVEKFRIQTTTVAVTDADVVRGTITGNIKIDAGEPLYPVATKAKVKVCSANGPCGLDDDGDGRFDRIALDDMVAALKLKEPVAYHIEERQVAAGDNFRQVISYLGISGDTLRLSYREFSNDMARPAFNEELTFPLAKGFPQQIAFKDLRMTILGIDGLGLRYRIEQ